MAEPVLVSQLGSGVGSRTGNVTPPSRWWEFEHCCYSFFEKAVKWLPRDRVCVLNPPIDYLTKVPKFNINRKAFWSVGIFISVLFQNHCCISLQTL